MNLVQLTCSFLNLIILTSSMADHPLMRKPYRQYLNNDRQAVQQEGVWVDPPRRFEGLEIKRHNVLFMVILKFLYRPYCLGTIVHRLWIVTTWVCATTNFQTFYYRRKSGIVNANLVDITYINSPHVVKREVERIFYHQHMRYLKGLDNSWWFSEVIMLRLFEPLPDGPMKPIRFAYERELPSPNMNCSLLALVPRDGNADRPTATFVEPFTIPEQDHLSDRSYVEIESPQSRKRTCVYSGGGPLVCNGNLTAITGFDTILGAPFCISHNSTERTRLVYVGQVAQWMNKLIVTGYSARIYCDIFLLLISFIFVNFKYFICLL